MIYFLFKCSHIFYDQLTSSTNQNSKEKKKRRKKERKDKIKNQEEEKREKREEKRVADDDKSYTNERMRPSKRVIRTQNKAKQRKEN